MTDNTARQADHCYLVGAQLEQDRNLFSRPKCIRLDADRDWMEASIGLVAYQQGCNLRQVESQRGQVRRRQWIKVSLLSLLAV